MVYNSSYNSSDISEVVIDNIVGVAAAVFGLVTVVALVVLYRWLRGKHM